MSKLMTLFGVNHKTATLSYRERCTLTREQIQQELKRIIRIPFVDGCIILFTCNRTEYYMTHNGSLEYFLQELFPEGHLFNDGNESHTYRMENTDALRHLFRVASGLDSQILGETEVLFQVKEAYRLSEQCGCLGKDIQRYFERAFRVGRKVRRETGISKGNVSISSLVIKLLDKSCGLKDRKVMLIGVNKVTKQIARYLIEHSIKTAFVGNRTFERAKELASALGGEAVTLDNLERLIAEVDVLISATSAPHYIVKKERVSSALKRRSKPVFFIDLAVPRDIDFSLKSHPMVVLYNLDDLRPLVENNLSNKMAEAKLAETIVEKEAERFSFDKFNNTQ